MTIQSWLDECMPVKAQKCTANVLVALQHASKKWHGLTREMLKKHDLTVSNGCLKDKNDAKFNVSAFSCSLCLIYVNCPDQEYLMGFCPLKIIRSGKPCDKKARGELDSPWHTWVKYGNPEPMINLIDAALAIELEKQVKIT